MKIKVMKKNSILIVFMLLVNISVYAYEPMLVKGRMWTQEIFCDVTMDGQNTYTYSDSIWIEKDTVINEQQYYKFSSGIIMREDIERQEVYTRINDTDYLIYNFKVNIGDTLLSKNLVDFALGLLCKFDYLVTDIDILWNHRTITLFPIIADTLNADEYTKMEYSNMMIDMEFAPEIKTYYELKWMEGVGDVFLDDNFFTRRIHSTGLSGHYCYSTLLCVQENDSSYYPLNMTKGDCYVAYTGTGKFALSVDNKVVAESLHAYLEGNTLKVVIPDNETLISISLFDITGKEVYSSRSSSLCHQLILPQGIYYAVVQTQNRIYSTKVIKQ